MKIFKSKQNTQSGFIPLILLVLLFIAGLSGGVLIVKDRIYRDNKVKENQQIALNEVPHQLPVATISATLAPRKSNPTPKPTSAPSSSSSSSNDNSSGSSNNSGSSGSSSGGSNNSSSNTNPTATPVPAVTVTGFFISESPIAEDQATPSQNQTTYPVTIDYQLAEGAAGTRTIFIRYFYSNGTHVDRQQPFIYRPGGQGGEDTPTPEPDAPTPTYGTTMPPRPTPTPTPEPEPTEEPTPTPEISTAETPL